MYSIKSLVCIVLVVVLLLTIPVQVMASNYSSQVEWQILKMVNWERAKEGLPKLQMDSILRDIAREHSKDMGDNNFFDHISPTTGSPTDRISAEGIYFYSEAENIAWNTSGSAYDTMYHPDWGWMSSLAGHREIILNKDFNYIGIGVYLASNNRYYYTQVFIESDVIPSFILDPMDENVFRLSGANRYATAVEISKSGWTEADTIVLARGDDYADALAGVPLAFHLNAPILLSPTASLHGVTEAEINRLGANRAILLGGTAAISNNVKEELEAKGLLVERIAGSNRYDTAARIAQRLSAEGAAFDTAFIAVGTNFADALAASSYAAIRGEPILLTETNSLPGATSDAISNLGITNSYVCGGTAAVSSNVFAQLPGAERISGPNRYATALALANTFLPHGAQHVGIATGLNFPDAIAGGVWAANYNTGILLVDGSKNEPSSEVQTFISIQGISGVTLFGGSGAISNAMEEWFDNNLND